jgi:hypothetical protein
MGDLRLGPLGPRAAGYTGTIILILSFGKFESIGPSKARGSERGFGDADAKESGAVFGGAVLVPRVWRASDVTSPPIGHGRNAPTPR